MRKRVYHLSSRNPIASLDRVPRSVWGYSQVLERVLLRWLRYPCEPRREASPKNAAERDLFRR